MRVALWSVPPPGETVGPRRLEQRRDFVEAHLESWIEGDAGLVMEGVTWIGRQVVFPDRSRLDLVGLTREGQLVVAELKADAVGIGALSQALHYALWFGALEKDNRALLGRLTLTEEQRDLLTSSLAEGELDVSILLVGTSRLPELDAAAAYLSARGLNIPVRIVTFTPFVDASGRILLAREVEEHDLEPAELSPRQRTSRAAKIEWVQELAREHGVGDVLDAYISTAEELGLRVKPWKLSITIVPPFTRGRTLLYFAPKPNAVSFGYSEENLVDLYGADPKKLAESLGENWIEIDPLDARARLKAFVEVMHSLQSDDIVSSAPDARAPGTEQVEHGP